MTIGRLLGAPELTTTVGELEDWYNVPAAARAAVLFACAKTQLFILVVLTGFKSRAAKARMLEAINEGEFLAYVADPARRDALRA